MCADCGGELVDEGQYLKLEEERAADEEAQRIALALRQAACLAGEKAVGSTIQAAEAETLCETDVPDSAVQGAADVGEDADRSAQEPERGADQSKKAAVQSAGALYQDSMERANENRSSAWMLMIMGGAGLVVIVLGIMGVIPLHFSNPYLFYGVMAAVFLLFLVAGVVSLKNARIFDKKAESENSLRDAMLAWCRENLRAQGLDSEIGMDGTESEEALYFKRFECIKAKLNYQFVNLDQGFLEKFIDDSVYDMIYEKTEEGKILH